MFGVWSLPQNITKLTFYMLVHLKSILYYHVSTPNMYRVSLHHTENSPTYFGTLVKGCLGLGGGLNTPTFRTEVKYITLTVLTILSPVSMYTFTSRLSITVCYTSTSRFVPTTLRIPTCGDKLFTCFPCNKTNKNDNHCLESHTRVLMTTEEGCRLGLTSFGTGEDYSKR